MPEFKEQIITLLQSEFPGRTIDGLICRPDEARIFCDKLRNVIGSSRLPDVIPLKSLLNIRKSKSCPTGLKGKGQRRVLATELRRIGCGLSPDGFRDVLVNAHVDMYKDQTVDTMLCHPTESKGLCDFVRRKTGQDVLTDEFILSTLMNVRKSQ
ncbi:hypothetical protein [Roseiconus lacunae]|uniref:DUF1018 domain-containing protein n=1 Tax=Roseiconus lacunae TaxID=2605694 RepID=A0ABT7PDV8_9BACT|nr:hypothetical protein [Roseiconus lacunae]MDM4014673.1 hypothetical protein [Roseiconus lacunae]